jgi:hypothetical protein
MMMTSAHKVIGPINGGTFTLSLKDMDGMERTKEMSTSAQEFFVGWQDYLHGALIQDAFPQLNASEREFILTGLTDEEWDAYE